MPERQTSRILLLQDAMSCWEQQSKSTVTVVMASLERSEVPRAPTVMASGRRGSPQHPSAKAFGFIQLQKQKSSFLVCCTSKEQLWARDPSWRHPRAGRAQLQIDILPKRLKTRHLSRQEAAWQMLHGFSHCSKLHFWASYKLSLLGSPLKTWLWRGCSCVGLHWCLAKPPAPGQGCKNQKALQTLHYRHLWCAISLLHTAAVGLSGAAKDPPNPANTLLFCLPIGTTQECFCSAIRSCSQKKIQAYFDMSPTKEVILTTLDMLQAAFIFAQVWAECSFQYVKIKLW